MTIVYADFVLGNDTSGDGTYSSPYKTLDKATLGLTGGDEVRVAQTEQVQLSGTCTFENKDHYIDTSVNLTTEVSVGDFIRHPATNEAWWLINQITATQLHCPDAYYGTAGSGKTVYRMRPVNLSTAHQKIVATGISPTNRLKISGGWDLSTQTKVGLTAVRGTYSIIYWYATPATYAAYLEISDFCVQRLDVEDGHGCYLHNIYISNGFVGITSRTTLENCWTGGGEIYLYGSYPGTGAAALRGQGNCVLRNIWLYSYDIELSKSSYNYFENVNVYGPEQWTLYYADYANNNFFKDCTFDLMEDADYALIYYDWGNYGDIFYNCTFKNATGAAIMAEESCSTGIATFIDCTFENNAMGIISAGSYTDDTDRMSLSPMFAVQNTTGDSFRFYKDGATITSTAMGSRSGKCLKFSPIYLFYDLQEPVGSYKVVSNSSSIDLSIYMKKDEAFVGDVDIAVIRSGCHLGFTPVTLTTDYVKQTITIPTEDLVVGEHLTMWVVVQGSAGNVFADDFSAE